MVLKTLVLPAPLGPITAVICPGAAANETLRSAWMPPKRRSTPSTASDRPAIDAEWEAGASVADATMFIHCQLRDCGMARRRASCHGRTGSAGPDRTLLYNMVTHLSVFPR